MGPILQTIAPVTHDLGGFKVHRTLPNKERTMVGSVPDKGSTFARIRISISRR